MHAWHDDVGRVATGGNGPPDHCRLTAIVRTVAPGATVVWTNGILAATSSTRLIRIRPVPRPRTSAARRSGLRLSPHDAGFPAAHITSGDHAPASPWRAATCAAKPRRSAEAKNALQAERTDPVLLVGHVPHRGTKGAMAFECPRRSSPPSPMFDADTGCIATDPAPGQASVPQQDGHRKPSGQRTRPRNSAHAVSDTNHASNSVRVRG